MPLDLTSLRNSVWSLSDLVAAAENDTRMAQFTEVERNGIRAGVIQNFEVTYELAWKMIARWLNANVGGAVADGLARRQLFRLAAQNRLIHDVETWMKFHETRNLTSHTYNEVQAETTYRAMREFAHEMRLLLGALEAHND